MEPVLLILGTLAALMLAGLLYFFLRVFVKRSQDHKELKKVEQWDETTNFVTAGDAKKTLEMEKTKLEGQNKYGRK
jgi:uncharacterized membrane protein YciS (DUF1049 family)